jgi:hypothetical protein
LAAAEKEAERLAAAEKEAERLAAAEKEAERLAAAEKEAERLAAAEKEAERLAAAEKEAETLPTDKPNKTIQEFNARVLGFIDEIENAPRFMSNTNRMLFIASIEQARLAIIEALSYVQELD